MISIIICSRKSDISSTLKENIQKTIGYDYELVVIDNSQNKHSIFTAYNEGVRRAKGDLLCFMHDDILYHTNGWGPIIAKHFRDDSEIGLIGFAGAHFLPHIPLYWDMSPLISEYDLTTRGENTEQCFILDHFGDDNLIDVAVIDGMCFFARKSIIQCIPFDEKTYQGFHLYDMDISMHIRENGYKVCVCREILIEHFYSYNPNKTGFELFEINLQKFYDKWSSKLPILVGLERFSVGTIRQLDNYVTKKVQLEAVHKNTLKSKSYRFAKAILHPIRHLKRN